MVVLFLLLLGGIVHVQEQIGGTLRDSAQHTLQSVLFQFGGNLRRSECGILFQVQCHHTGHEWCRL